MDPVDSPPTRSAWMPSTTCCGFTPMSIRTSAEATMKLECFVFTREDRRNCPHCKFWMADPIPTTRKAPAGPSRGKAVKFLSLNYI